MCDHGRMTETLSPQGAALAGLMFEALRLGGALAQAGDALMAPIGLTAARWQVLATVAHLAEPQTVAGLARALSLTRQSVQRVVGEMAAAGLLTLADNPSHRRARLVVLTPAGAELAARAEARREPWTEALARGCAAEDLTTAEAVLRALRERLARAADPG